MSDAERVLALVIDREPTTLHELEALVGPVPRADVHRATAHTPYPDVALIACTFVGPSIAALRADPDPALASVVIATRDVPCTELAATLLAGPPPWPRGHGTFAPGSTSTRLVWERAEPVHPRTSADEALLVEAVAELVDEGIAAATALFGPFHVDGRRPSRVAHGPGVRVEITYGDDPPRHVELRFTPPLPADPLVAALGWHDLLVTRSGGPHYALTGEQRFLRSAEGHVVHVDFVTTHDIEPLTPYARAFRDQLALVGRLHVGGGS